jgi:chromosome segregation ATPase
MAETASLLSTDQDVRAELRREQDRLAKLWQAFKNAEDELEHLRKERPVMLETVADQDRSMAKLRSEMAQLREQAGHSDRAEELERRNRILLIEVENLNREMRAAQHSLEQHAKGESAHVASLEADLRKEQERLAKLYQVYEEREAELKAAQARLAKWESWFSRMEPAIVALPKFFADAPRA